MDSVGEYLWIVDPGLDPTVVESLERTYSGHPDIQVMRERRRFDRRGGRRSQRYVADGGSPELRVGERRAPLVETPLPPLPPGLAISAEGIRFVERVNPSAEHLRDQRAKRLALRVQAGDGEAYAELYELFFSRIYGFLKVMLHSTADAEDAVQDVFIKVFAALPSWRCESGHLESWVFTIARNHATNLLKRSARCRPEDPEMVGARADEAAAPVEDPQDWSDGEMLALIARLPEAQRQVLVLRYMLDLSARRTAEVLGKTPEAVRQTHRRALSSLRGRALARG